MPRGCSTREWAPSVLWCQSLWHTCDKPCKHSQNRNGPQTILQKDQFWPLNVPSNDDLRGWNPLVEFIHVLCKFHVHSNLSAKIKSLLKKNNNNREDKSTSFHEISTWTLMRKKIYNSINLIFLWKATGCRIIIQLDWYRPHYNHWSITVKYDHHIIYFSNIQSNVFKMVLKV